MKWKQTLASSLSAFRIRSHFNAMLWIILLEAVSFFSCTHATPLSSSLPNVDTKETALTSATPSEEQSVQYNNIDLESSIEWSKASTFWDQDMSTSKASLQDWPVENTPVLQSRLHQEINDESISLLLSEVLLLHSSAIQKIQQSSQTPDALVPLMAQIAESILNDYNHRPDINPMSSSLFSVLMPSSDAISSISSSDWPSLSSDFAPRLEPSSVLVSNTPVEFSWGFNPAASETLHSPLKEVVSKPDGETSSSVAHDRNSALSHMPPLVTEFRPSELRMTPLPTPEDATSSVTASFVDKYSESLWRSSDFGLESDSNLLSSSIHVIDIASAGLPIISQLVFDEHLSSAVTSAGTDILPSSSLTPALPALLVNKLTPPPPPQISSSVVMTSVVLQTATMPELHSIDVLSNLPDIIKVEELDRVRPNSSDVTVDKIIQGLMNIIRPINKVNVSNVPTPATLSAPPPLVIPVLHEELVKNSTISQAPPNEHPNTPLDLFKTGLLSNLTFNRLPLPASDTNHNSNNVLISNLHPGQHPDDPTFSAIQTVLHNTGWNPGQQSHDDPIKTTTKLKTESPPPKINHFSASSTSPSVENTHLHIFTVTKRPILKRPSSTSTTTTTRSTTTTVKQRPSKKPLGTPSTSPKPVFVSPGEAKPVLFDLTFETNPPMESMHLSADTHPLADAEVPISAQEAVIASNVVQLNEHTPPPPSPFRPSLIFASTHHHKKPSSPDSDHSVQAIPVLLNPSLSSSSSRPPVVPVPIRIISSSKLHFLSTTRPLLEAAASTTEPILMEHFTTSSTPQVVSTQSAILIRPTSSSSMVVRKTIFQTVVSISSDDTITDDDKNNESNVPEDPVEDNFSEHHVEGPADVFHGGSADEPEVSIVSGSDSIRPGETVNVGQTSRRTTTSTAKTTTTTSTTTMPTAPSTRRPLLKATSATKAAFTRATRRTTTAKPTTTARTRRPFRPSRRTTTRRPLLKRKPSQSQSHSHSPSSHSGSPQSDSAVTSTERPQRRPTHSLFSFGMSLLPAAVLATAIGLPLAIAAGKKKRDISDKNMPLLDDNWYAFLKHTEETFRKGFK